MSTEPREIIRIAAQGIRDTRDTEKRDMAELMAESALAALKRAGYTLVRPVTDEEEAANVW